MPERGNAQSEGLLDPGDDIEKLRDPSFWDDNVVIDLDQAGRFERGRGLPPQ